MIIYRIRNSEGKYSTGGSCPSFTKKGKIWKNIGHLKLHFNQLWKSAESRYEGCTLESYEIRESMVNSTSLIPLMKDYLAGKEIKIQTRKVKAQQDKYLQEKKLYEELKEKFEKQ